MTILTISVLVVVAYLAIGLTVLMFDMRLFPDAWWKVKTEDVVVEEVVYQPDVVAAIQQDMRRWAEASVTPRGPFGSAKPEDVETVMVRLDSIERMLNRKYSRREKRDVGFGEPLKDAGHMTTVFCWPLAVVVILVNIIDRATKRSVNEKTRARLELEKELATLMREMDNLRPGGPRVDQ